MGVNFPNFSDDKNIDTSRLSTQISKIANALQRLPFINFQLLETGLATSAGNKVYHSLGYKPKGYIIIQKDAGNSVYNGTINSSYIEFFASSDTNFSAIIF